MSHLEVALLSAVFKAGLSPFVGIRLFSPLRHREHRGFFDFLCGLSGSAVNSRRNLCVRPKRAELQLGTLLVRAFGIVPGIVLTALFYSFHHIGFQPEYIERFFTGLLYATTCQIGNSVLLIFPFFLGVGGIYDVVVQQQAAALIPYPGIRTLYLAVLIVATVVLAWRMPKSDPRASVSLP